MSRQNSLRLTRLKLLLVLVTVAAPLVLSPWIAYADCVSNATRFKVCPDDLPDLPNYKLLCSEGCFLFHPSDEIAARFNKARVALIPGLELKADRLAFSVIRVQSERDRAIVDAGTYQAVIKDGLLRERDLKRDLDKAYSTGDIALALSAGMGAGMFTAVVAGLVLAFLSP